MIKEHQFGAVKALEQGRELFFYRPPWMTVYCYAIDGLLIDAGLACFKKQVSEFVAKNQVHMAAITHHHEDHSGNAQLINELNKPLFASKEAGEKLESGFQVYPYQVHMWGKAKKAHALKIPKLIETNNYQFDIIAAPGHCDDQIVLFEKNQGWLFSGDVFLNEKIKYFRADENFEETVATLRNLCQLKFETIFCAHRPRLKNGNQSLKMKLEYLLEIQGKTEDLINEGFNEEAIRDQILGKENRLLQLLTFGDVSKLNLIKAILGLHKNRLT